MVYKEEQTAEDSKASGEVMLLLDGARLNVKAYRQFETCMDR